MNNIKILFGSEPWVKLPDGFDNNTQGDLWIRESEYDKHVNGDGVCPYIRATKEQLLNAGGKVIGNKVKLSDRIRPDSEVQRYIYDEIVALENKLEEAYDEMAKQRVAITAVFNREVWNRVDKYIKRDKTL